MLALLRIVYAICWKLALIHTSQKKKKEGGARVAAELPFYMKLKKMMRRTNYEKRNQKNSSATICS